MTPIDTNPTKRPIVLIATPAHDHKLHVCMAVSVMNLIASRKVACQVFIPSQCGVSKGRNHCLWHFLNNYKEATHILYWDADIQATPDMLLALLERKLPAVGWLYSHKSEALRWCVNLEKPPGAKDDDEVGAIQDGPMAGLLPVEHIGTGGLLIERAAIEKLVELYGEELAYIEDQESEGSSTPMGAKSYAFCQERIISENGPEDKLARINALAADNSDDDMLTVSRKYNQIKAIINEPQKPARYFSEDWFLCRLLRRAGFSIYAETRFHVLHEGLARYPSKEHRSSPWVEEAAPAKA